MRQYGEHDQLVPLLNKAETLTSRQASPGGVLTS